MNKFFYKGIFSQAYGNFLIIRYSFHQYCNKNLYTLAMLLGFMLLLPAMVKAQGNVAIGIASPDASAQLHLQSGVTSKGLLIPRLTSSQRGLIISPALGLMVYETTTNRFYYNVGDPKTPTWRYLLTQADLPAVNAWGLSGNNLVNNSSFLGTTNANSLPLRINGNQVGLFHSNHASVKLGLHAGTLANGAGIITLGNNALAKSTTLSNLIAIGDSALYNFRALNEYPSYHEGQVIAIGGRAAMMGATQNFLYEHNVAVGYGALYGPAGKDNIAIGYYALANGPAAGYTLQNNTAIGWRALGDLSVGSRNTAIGYEAGNNLQEGSGNTFLGYNANVPAGTTEPINNATAIGANALVSSSNTMAFGNTTTEFFLFGQSGPTIGGVAFQVNTYTVGGIRPFLSKTGTWTNTSDSSSKTNITPINETELYQQVKNLPITQWQYNGDTTQHIGPMAQDFHHQLQLGDDEKGISTVDPAGVALATLQILIKKNKELKARLDALEKK